MNCFCLRGSDDLFSHLRPINLWGIVLILCHWDTFCASVMTTVSVLLKEDVKLGKIDDLSPLGPDLKIIGSDSVQIREQLKRFSSISRCWTLGSPHWLAVNGSKHTAELPLKSLFLLFVRYWVTFQSLGVIWIHVSAACVAQLSQSVLRISSSFFTHSFISENDLGLSLHAEMLCSCLI